MTEIIYDKIILSVHDRNNFVIILSVETERFSVRAGLGNVYNEICRNVVSGRYFALPIQTQIITVHSLS